MASSGWEDMTEADARRLGKQPALTQAIHERAEAFQAPPSKRAKFGNKKTYCAGIMFDSGHEANRYLELKALMELGDIRDLELQPKYGIFACELSTGKGIEVASFKADFRYFDVKADRMCVEDAKSDGTKGETAYRLRKKIVEACHGITIEEV